MITFPKIRAAAYAIRKHFSPNAYQLLKNPKGTPGTQVHLIRYTDSIDPETLDIKETFTTIRKDYVKVKPKVFKETFERITYRFYDDNYNLVNSKRFARYYKKNYKGINVSILAEGEPISIGENNRRNVSHLHKKIIPNIEINPDVSILPQEHPFMYAVTKLRSFAQQEIERYYSVKHSGTYYSFERQISFWKTLWQNLSQ